MRNRSDSNKYDQYLVHFDCKIFYAPTEENQSILFIYEKSRMKIILFLRPSLLNSFFELSKTC